MRVSCSKTNVVQASYVGSQFLSVGCAFAGSMFALYDYNYPHNRTPSSPFIYIGVFGFSLFLATAAALIASKFQGIKVGSDETHSPHARYPYDIAPRNWISNMVEILYLIFTTSLIFVDNYFFLAAIEATYKSLQDPNGNYPIIPLGGMGLTALVMKSVLIDFPFKVTNAQYSATEELKEDITGSKAGPFVSILLKPLTSGARYYFLLTWVKIVGAISFVLTNYIGMLLSIPLGLWTFLYSQLGSVGGTIGLIVALSTPLIIVNYIQTLYCEGKESENNLKRIKRNNSFFSHGSGNDEDKNLLRQLLHYMPSLTKPIHYGFYSQGVIRGGNDTMPVVFFLQDFFDRISLSNTAQTSIIAIASVLVFLGSLLGTHFSEVTTAIENYEKDFEKDFETEEPVLRGLVIN